MIIPPPTNEYQGDPSTETVSSTGIPLSEQLQNLGLLAGIFAHDFNNFLTTILGYTSLAYTQTPPNSPLQHQLREALTSGNRAKELVQHILKAYHDTQLPYVPLCFHCFDTQV